MTEPVSTTPRVKVLLDAMTLEEKIGQLTMVRPAYAEGSSDRIADEQREAIRAGRIGSMLDIWGRERIGAVQVIAVAESRLKVPILFTYDVLHGYETIFPSPLGEASAFNPALWEATARVAAMETAVEGVALTFAPMLDVARDPRWGRIMESPGEDPWLASRFAEAKVRGFQQGNLARPSAVAATAKHLGAYGAVMAGREYAQVDISERTLHEVHLPAFRAAVEAGVAAIMPAFIDIAGVPMTANRAILQGIVRDRWGFDGIMISDFAAVGELLSHGVAADLAEAAALALKAGIDIDMASDAYPKGLMVALERGLITETDIDAAVIRVLRLKERLGLFDDTNRAAPTPPPFAAHRDLAREAAARAIVLLQDHDSLIPIDATNPRRLAVIGPLAKAPGENMFGPWWAAGKSSEAVDFLTGITTALPDWQITHAQGCEVEAECSDASAMDTAIAAAHNADLVILCLGESVSMCGEGGSRTAPGIPGVQRTLAEAVLATGTPVIVTLTCGRPLIAPWLFEAAGTVLATWHLGSEAGNALADILTGRRPPSGKLPVTWPAHPGQIPIFFAQNPTGRPANPADRLTSKWLDAPITPQFPFGHGLTGSRVSYTNLRISAETVRRGDALTVTADITNHGPQDIEETAFLFIRDTVASIARPVLELRGAARIALAAGKCGTISFVLRTEDLTFPGHDWNPLLEPGTFEVHVGPDANRANLLTSRILLLAD